jgi:hypothetical protein
VEGECFETHTGPESSQMHTFKKETPFKQAHQAHKHLFSPSTRSIGFCTIWVCISSSSSWKSSTK